MNDLEVLDGGLGDAPVEVEDVGLGLFIPAGGFVHQGDEVVCVAVLMASQQSLNVLKGAAKYESVSKKIFTNDI